MEGLLKVVCTWFQQNGIKVNEIIVHLWNQLSTGDKARVAASLHFPNRLTTGRFKQAKTSRLSGVVPGVDSVRR